MIINGIEIGGGTASGSSGTSGVSGTSGTSGTSGSSGSSGVSGSLDSSRFITTPTTLSSGKEHVYYDLFLFDSFNISEYNATYSIAGTSFYNNAMVSILDSMWIDDTLYVGGDLNIGI
jgi:hypothetical protein